MELNKYFPEGWNGNQEIIDKNDLVQSIETGRILEAKVNRCDLDCNLHFEFSNGLTGVLPKENIDNDLFKNDKTKKYFSKTNKILQFIVKDVDEIDKNKYILSRVEVKNKIKEWIQNDLKEGQILNGIVRSIKSYGAFIEIAGGVVGLLHIEDISVGRIRNPAERLSIGQKIKIMVKSINRENNQVFLTYKEFYGTWEENVEKIQEGQTVQGIVRERERNKNGIFIEITPNLIGLAEYSETLEYGTKVKVYVKKIQRDKKKIKLVVVE